MIYFILFLLLMSLIDLILYKVDKVRAQKNQWRIRESVLLGTGFFGGAIGALLAMKLFRHKTKHWYFWAVNILGLLFQAFVFWLMFLKK